MPTFICRSLSLPLSRQPSELEQIAVLSSIDLCWWSSDSDDFQFKSRGSKKTICSHSYRETSLIRNSAPLGPYSRTMPRALWWSLGGGLFLMSEVPL